MKYQINNFKRLVYFCLIFMVLGCEKELYDEMINSKYKKQIQSKYLSEVEAQRLINVMSQNIQNSNKLSIYSKGKNQMRTSQGTIDYSKILEVIDTLGIKNYTFKVINHPESNEKTFFNFVMNEKDSTNYSYHLFKYQMSDTFFNELENGIKKIYEFQGSITNYRLDSNDPCEKDIVISNPPLLSPVNGGSVLGGGYSPGSSGNSGSGSTGAGGYDVPEFTEFPDCYVYFISACCHGVHYGEFDGCKCKDVDGNIGATYLINICEGGIRQIHREMYDECDPKGAIGIIDVFVEKPCDQLKDLIDETCANLKPDIDWLKEKAGLNVEYGVEVQKRQNPYGDTFNYPTVRKESPEQYTVELNIGQSYIGGLHCHPEESYGIPSFADVMWLRDCYVKASSTRQPYAFSMLVVKNNDGTKSVYAMMINDFEKLNLEVNKVWDHSEYAQYTDESEKIDKIHKKQAIKFDESNGQIEKSFLQQFGAFGIDIYKSNDESLTNWNKLTLENNNNQLNVVAQPCN